jgi:hypothetical protein
MEEFKMSTNGFFAIRSRMSLTILATMGWLVWGLCWMAFAWGHYSFFQNLVSLGIATLLYAAITGTMRRLSQETMGGHL